MISQSPSCQVKLLQFMVSLCEECNLLVRLLGSNGHTKDWTAVEHNNIAMISNIFRLIYSIQCNSAYKYRTPSIFSGKLKIWSPVFSVLHNMSGAQYFQYYTLSMKPRILSITLCMWSSVFSVLPCIYGAQYSHTNINNISNVVYLNILYLYAFSISGGSGHIRK